MWIVYLSNMHIIVVLIDLLFISQVLRIFIIIFLWNQEMLYSLRMCFHGKQTRENHLFRRKIEASSSNYYPLEYDEVKLRKSKRKKKHNQKNCS